MIAQGISPELLRYYHLTSEILETFIIINLFFAIHTVFIKFDTNKHS